MNIGIKDISGDTYGQLTVLSFVRRANKGTNSYWLCKCSCGKEVVKGKSGMRQGLIVSCGCWKTSHGEAQRTKEYKTWASMKKRCGKNPMYIGITVCERWIDSYENFLSDMGRSPSTKHSIDRINNSGNYEPSNCRWATNKEQQNNTSRNHIIIYKGKRYTLTEAATEFNQNVGTIKRRLKDGWDVNRAIEQPPLFTGYRARFHKPCASS